MKKTTLFLFLVFLLILVIGQNYEKNGVDPEEYLIQNEDVSTKENSSSLLPTNNATSSAPTQDKMTQNADQKNTPNENKVPLSTSEKTASPTLNLTDITKNISTNWGQINADIRKSLVNIICVSKYSGYFKPASASAILLNNEGLVLTNAHVAQYILLSDKYKDDSSISCNARFGSPAKGKSSVELVFIPSIWIQKNAGNINETKIYGNGENDMALLKVDISGQNLKPIKIDTKSILMEGENVALAGYPGSYIGGELIQMDLNIVSTFSTISKIMTFEKGTSDFIKMDASVLAQGGSSGGIVSNKEGLLIGLIAVAMQNEKGIQDKVGAITTFHMKQVLKEELNLDFPKIIESEWPRIQEKTLSDIDKIIESLELKLEKSN